MSEGSSNAAITAAHDVLLVGGGAAGLRAAIAIAESNPDLDVAVVSKVYPMRSHTVSAEGGAAGVMADDDTIEEHIYDTISGSDWLGDQDAIEAFVNEAPRELLQLEHWGCPWSRQDDGRIAVRAFGGMKNKRTWFAADKTGFHMLHALFQTSLKYGAVKRYDESFVTRLLADDGRVHGVVAIELATGKIQAITAKAVVLATGGGGKVFPFTTNANINTGDGMALAYRAGAPLKDMEFVQYHPTGLPFTGILITEATRAEGGWLLNKDGYRYLQDYDLGTPTDTPTLRSMELGPRDRLSQAFEHEVQKGRTDDSPYGPIVYLDLRHLGEKLIEAKLPMVRELCLQYERIDPVTELIPVRPVVHYMMGGVHTDIDGKAGLDGLYAAGETACVSINGANRLGSNSLPECLVFGARAGRAAAEYAATAPAPPAVIDAQIADEVRRLEAAHGPRQQARGRDRQDCATSCRRPWRTRPASTATGPRWRRGSTRSVRCGNESTAIGIRDTSQAFNTELVGALELANLVDIGECILRSGLAREESRGAHQRTDFTARDDERFLAHHLVRRDDDGTARVEQLPVTITRWPPGERVYGR